VDSSRTATDPSGSPVELDREEVAAARASFGERVLETPLIGARWLAERIGAAGPVGLKAESLQRTGSFKARGATVKLDRLGEAERAAGVVVASAGNHGQAVAYAARARGVPCRVYMPARASVAKITAVEEFGGQVVLGGESIEDCLAAAREHAAGSGAAFVHPFDDRDVLVGQATVALELLEQAPQMDALVVPLGGGGLLGAVAATIKAARPEVRIVGVQVENCAPYAAGAAEGAANTATGRSAAPVHLADGIAVKRPGELTRPLIERWVDEVHTVSEDAIAEAMVQILQRSKLVAEGAGAVGVAALLEGQVEPAGEGETVVVLSGGNVDVSALVAVARRHESVVGRRFHLFTRVPDRPGGLATLLAAVAEAGANVLAAEHRRDGVPLHVGETGVELVLETRGSGHSQAVADALAERGYPIEGSSLDPGPGEAPDPGRRLPG
jgi:threonine dehydratase